MTENNKKQALVLRGSTVLAGPITEELAKQIERLGVKYVGFEKTHVTYSTFEAYKAAVTSAQLVPVGGIVEGLRLYKDEAEISVMKEAAKIADAAFEHIITFIKPIYS